MVVLGWNKPGDRVRKLWQMVFIMETVKNI